MAHFRVVRTYPVNQPPFLLRLTVKPIQKQARQHCNITPRPAPHFRSTLGLLSPKAPAGSIAVAAAL
jgi:hypothetical protein